MSKELHKAIMKRSRLRNKFLKHRTDTNKKNYNTQKNLCKKLLKNTKKSYFENFDTKKITDNRSFWKAILPLFTQNSSKGEKINLIDESEIIFSDEEPCETFNQFFSNVVSTLNIPKPKPFPKASDNLDSMMSVIKSFDKDPSIFKIKAKGFDSTFHFRKTSCNEVEKIISNLNIKKSCQKEDIPTKIIKLNKDLIAKLVAENCNSCIDKGEFPFELKHADIVPIHKRKDKSDKSNYRPVSMLSNYSKVYEKVIHNQLYQYFENALFPSQCGFRKGYSQQHGLLVLIEKFEQAIDTGNKFGALLNDLSKAFDCLDHSLLVAKLHWYGLSPLSLKLVFSYFSNRTHRIKFKKCFSNRLKIEYGVQQGSILGPLLSNINSIDILYESEDSVIENYADDTTP